MLAIPILAPAVLAAYAVAGERQQGSLEPVLTTPIPREEFLLGKAICGARSRRSGSRYVVYVFFLVCVALFAQPEIAAAILGVPDIAAQVVFTPLLAGWSIWVGIAISTRASDVRVAQQLTLAREPAARHRDVAHRLRRDPRHARPGDRGRGDPDRRRRPRLAGRVADVRPRAADHRDPVVRASGPPGSSSAPSRLPLDRRC